MRKFMLVFLIVVMVPRVGMSQKAPGKVGADLFKAGVSVLRGFAAAETMRRAGNASVDYKNASMRSNLAQKEYERARRARIDGVAQQFSSQDLPRDKTAIYSIFLNIDYNATSVYWADSFSKPDVFFVVEIEDIGMFVLPDIRVEYKGGPVLDRLVLPELRPGSRVVVRVLDDDTTGDAVWNSILRNRLDYRFTIDGAALPALGGIRSRLDLRGGFHILDGHDAVVLDGPDQIATVMFRVPETRDRTWVADGELRDASDRPTGRVQFSQVWNSRAELASLEAELSASQRKEASSFGWLMFWGTLVALTLTWICGDCRIPPEMIDERVDGLNGLGGSSVV